MAHPFRLHSRLAADTFTLGRLKLCRVLLMNDSRYPWCLLVPARAGVTEIHQLSDGDQGQLIRESSLLASRMMDAFPADKMNVASLGNVVPQLHVHHVARRRGDAAWPGPVWGAGAAVPYDERRLAETCARIERALQGIIEPSGE